MRIPNWNINDQAAVNYKSTDRKKVQVPPKRLAIITIIVY
jgi:hypothetical protein